MQKNKNLIQMTTAFQARSRLARLVRGDVKNRCWEEGRLTSFLSSSGTTINYLFEWVLHDGLWLSDRGNRSAPGLLLPGTRPVCPLRTVSTSNVQAESKSFNRRKQSIKALFQQNRSLMCAFSRCRNKREIFNRLFLRLRTPAITTPKVPRGRQSP